MSSIDGRTDGRTEIIWFVCEPQQTLTLWGHIATRRADTQLHQRRDGPIDGSPDTKPTAKARALAALKQEPVAWKRAGGRKLEAFCCNCFRKWCDVVLSWRGLAPTRRLCLLFFVFVRKVVASSSKLSTSRSWNYDRLSNSSRDLIRAKVWPPSRDAATATALATIAVSGLTCTTPSPR